MVKGRILSLPAVTSAEQLRRFRADPSLWMPMARDIAHGHGYSGLDITAFATGTNLVLGLGDQLILKIFPPMHRGQFVSERGALRVLAGQLRIGIPELVHEGEREHWPYLVMTRLAGTLASDVWPGLAEPEKEQLLRQLGRTIAEVQRVPPGELLQIEPDWPTFMRGQIAGCRARHQRLGLAAKFLDGLDDLLRDAQDLIPMDRSPVILTGEYIPENFLLSRHDDGWTVSGLFDFGDVLTGWGEYDLLGPSAFMAAGRPGRVRSLFEGYGYAATDIDARRKRRLLALLLLHRASDPNRHICIADWPSQANDLDGLQELIWPT
jgi:hygromycin-B 7''-O-kinase